MKRFLQLLQLEYNRGTHLICLYELRHFMVAWAIGILVISTIDFVLLVISIPEYLWLVVYCIAVMRIPYLFGINEFEEEKREWETRN